MTDRKTPRVWDSTREYIALQDASDALGRASIRLQEARMRVSLMPQPDEKLIHMLDGILEGIPEAETRAATQAAEARSQIWLGANGSGGE